MSETRPDKASIPAEREQFLLDMLRTISGTLQDVVGLEEAAGYISIVGAEMGDRIDSDYRKSLKVDRLSKEQVAEVLVDLKRRIQGDFYIIEEREDRIVLGNRTCPFGDRVKDRPSLCMMTSNVFGRIAAENLGYARVDVQKAIARGDPGCLVVVHLVPTEELDVNAREYFRTDAD